MRDIWTIYWKEGKELLAQGNRQVFIRLLIMAAMGVWLPIQIGQDWLKLPWYLVLFLAFYPLVIIFTFIADAFAGERERHTLETLLASRISDWSIVLGKSLILLTLSWGSTLLTLILGLVVANIRSGGAWQFYPLQPLGEILALGVVDALLAIFIGIAVSLHSKTVRQAQQTLSYGLLGTAILISLLISQLGRLSLFNHPINLGNTSLMVDLIGVLLVVDVILFTVIMVSFQRSRLLLN